MNRFIANRKQWYEQKIWVIFVFVCADCRKKMEIEICVVSFSILAKKFSTNSVGSKSWLGVTTV